MTSGNPRDVEPQRLPLHGPLPRTPPEEVTLFQQYHIRLNAAYGDEEQLFTFNCACGGCEKIPPPFSGTSLVPIGLGTLHTLLITVEFHC